MLRELPRRRWVIDRMNGTAATANQPANDRHILAYLKAVLAKLGLEGTNHKFRHSFCTTAVNNRTPCQARPGAGGASAKSWRSNMTRCSKSLENKARSIRRFPTSGEGGIRTRGPAFDRTRL